MWKKRIFNNLAVLCLLIALSAAWLLLTQSGLNVVVSLTQKLQPDLHIDQAKGRLLGELTMSGIHYLPENSHGAEIEQLSLNWKPGALFKATVFIESLKLSGVNLHLADDGTAAEKTDKPLPDIQLPFRIKLSGLMLENVNVIGEDGEQTTLIKQFQSAVALDGRQLTIASLQLLRDDLNGSLTGSVALQSPYPMSMEYQLEFSPPALSNQTFQLTGSVTGDIDKLTIEQQLLRPILSSQTIVLTEIENVLQWTLQAQAEAIDFAVLMSEQTTRIEGVAFQASGDLTGLNARLVSRVLQPEIPPVALNASIESDDLENWQLLLNAGISEAQTLQVSGTVDTGKALPSADVIVRWQNLGWPLTGDETRLVKADGELALNGTWEQYRAALTSTLDWQQQTLALSAKSTGSLSQLQIESLHLAGFDGELQASGMLDWQSMPMQYQLEADWQHIALPASLTQRSVMIDKGHVSLEAHPQSLVLATKATMTVDAVNVQLQATGTGESLRGFDNARVTLGLAEGRVDYQGPIFWQGESLLEGNLVLTDVNPGVLATEWPGKLNGRTRIRLSEAESGLAASVEALAIQGELRGRPISLGGSLSYSKQLIDVAALQLQSGQSKLLANGQLQEQNIDFNWTLQSPDLQDFYPLLSGKLNAEGKMAGTLQNPSGKLKLKAHALAYQQFQAGAVDANASITLTDNADLSATISVQNIGSPQLDIDSLTLTLQGKQKQHEITLSIASRPLTLSVRANGGLQQERGWQGQFEKFAFSNDRTGQWQLTESGPMMLSAELQTIPQHCWASHDGEFCLEGRHRHKQWQASGQFAKLPLSLFEGFIAELAPLQGDLRGQFSLASDPKSFMTGEGEVFLDNASLQLDQLALNQRKPLKLDNVSLHYQLGSRQSAASFHMEPVLEGVSAVHAELQTADFATVINRPQQAGLTGTITSSIQDLSQLELSHPAFGDLKGQLAVNLVVGGNVAQPSIEGSARLQEGQLALVDAGIVLKQIDANLQGDIDQLNFNLQASSGEGNLTGEGYLKLTDASWELTSHIKGRQFEAMNTPEALIIAEPDISLTITPDKTQIKGKVFIPSAQLEPMQLNSAVSPSRDVVLVGDRDKTAKPGPVTEVDLVVGLGDKVWLRAVGFQGRLMGDLRVFGDTADILLANGEILIRDGSYLAYGQTLQVDDGSIRFADGPVDNPQLDIKALRKGKTYQAGLHIQGMVDAPQVELYSDPVMGQDDILSYILLGKPLRQASATDAALLASAATGMGLQNGAMIGDEIASTFGLDEFSLQGDSAENAAVQIGKYLSPKLYLSYGIGVFESVSTVELRYQLSKIWTIKAESGTESGVDLLYTYERGGPED